MATVRLSQRFADKVRLEESAVSKEEYYDLALKGFYLEVRRTGGKTWRLRLKDEDGNLRVVDLGDAACITYARAREAAKSLKAASQLKQWDLIASVTSKSERGPEFGEFVRRHYLPYIKSRKRSYETDVSILDNHILPVFSNRLMEKISKAELVTFHSEKRQSGYAAGTVDRLIILIRYIYNLAIKWGYLKKDQNPAAEFELFNEPNGRQKFLSDEELSRLMAELLKSDNTDLYNIVRGLLLTGCRKRELLDAQWQHVNFALKIWHIPLTKQGKPHDLPITDDLEQYFRSLPSLGNSQFLLPSPRTGMPYQSVFQSWDSARRAADLPDLRMHDLRHSFASFLVNGGCSLYEVQRLLGHTNSKTTQRYAHLSQAALHDAMKVAGRHLVVEI